jgi:PleD family two-component response regulator
MHGGHVSAASEGLRKGSRFTVLMPTTGAPAGVTTIVQEPPIEQARKLRVLVVDDNRDAAESLAMLLDEHEVECAFDGETALAIAQHFHADAVILDIGLPGIDGYELARRLRAGPETEQAILIALSGLGAPGDVMRSREAGCTLTLPANFGSLS